ncbi:MAG: GNAT family N-acetyltransferase [Gammaproteobacteria bacterium]
MGYSKGGGFMNISFRPVGAEDRSFLYKVYVSTRLDELTAVAWNARQKEAFLDMQFNAQQRHYQEHYADAEFLLILLGAQPVGRLYTARRPNEIRIIDISLLPDHRNSGIGSIILNNLIVEARDQMKPLRIHVERSNPAARLYRRLGFVPIGEHGIYSFMERPVDRNDC